VSAARTARSAQSGLVDRPAAALIEHVKPNPEPPGRPDPDADDGKPGNAEPSSYTGVRTAGELYVRYTGAPVPEYYNTLTDPHQEHNDPANPRTTQLAKALHQLTTCGRPGHADCWTAAHLR
jgi:N-acetylglucosamine-6-sulfatase